MCPKHHIPLFSEMLEVFPYANEMVLLMLVLLGFVGSLTHCVAMCGPLSISISSMRLMTVPKEKMKQSSKLAALFATPYYLGKALTYAILGTMTALLKSAIEDYFWYEYISSALLIILGIVFAGMALGHSLEFMQKFGILSGKFITKRFEAIIYKPESQYGATGFITGMILGLIPCGMVYAAIGMANTAFDSPYQVFLALFLFGISTIPGLFIVGCFGALLLNHKTKKIMKIIYSMIMFISALFMFYYALKVV